MLTPEQGWLLGICLLSIAAAVVFSRRGSSAALGVIVAASFAFPVWAETSKFGIDFSLQSSAAILGLVAFAIRTPWEIRSPLVLLDGIVAAIVILHVCSDVHHGQPVVGTSFFAYGEWAIPYVAGRFAARKTENLPLLATCVTVAVIVLGVGGTIESLTRINPWEIVFGERPLEGVDLNSSRFGFKRAYGTTLHPIYFSTLILILSPWPVALWTWGQFKTQRMLAMSGCVAAVAGITSSISRGPFLAIIPFVIGTGAIWSRWVRAIGLILLATTIGLLVFNTDSVVNTMEKLGGDSRRKTGIRLDGKQVEVSSAQYRLVLFQVYWPAMKDSGVLGYGSKATNDFPPDVPHLPKAERSQQILKYVDNAFLLQGLRFGWTGAALLVALFVVSIWTGISLCYDRSLELIAGTLTSMLIAFALISTTVWMAYDFKFEFLWSCGILAGLASSARRTDEYRGR